MTGPDGSPGSRPISVAELLAKNGTIGAPPPVIGRRRRRRGNSDAVTVAKLTGESPVLEDGERTVDDETAAEAPYWSELDPHRPGDSAGQPGAEEMSPDPPESYADMPIDVMDTELREAPPATGDSAYVRSYLRRSARLLFGGKTAAEDVEAQSDESAPDRVTDIDGDDIDDAEDYPDLADDDADDIKDADTVPSRTETLLRGGAVVLQSILAVVLGALLFIAFDQLWRWNNIVALVLSVLVILGLVVGVSVVRKTEDIGSTLIAVAVGLLVTLGPLALLHSG